MQITLDDGVLAVETPIAIKTPELVVDAILNGIVGFNLVDDELRLSGAFQNVHFTKVDVIDGAWNPETIRNLMQTFVNSMLPALKKLSGKRSYAFCKGYF
ncbi:MAG: hypothetical protein GY927_17245 [bacterium]|nr:hypothetical protein [bacterium]